MMHIFSASCIGTPKVRGHYYMYYVDTKYMGKDMNLVMKYYLF